MRNSTTCTHGTCYSNKKNFLKKQKKQNKNEEDNQYIISSISDLFILLYNLFILIV